MSNATINQVIDPVEMADKINAHLKDGGAVMVATYTKRTIYKSNHAGWFSARGPDLFVRRGRRHDALSSGGHLGVAIRFGHYE